jgi:hypothetical protein
MEVVYKAMAVGLDLLTLPSHTSHRLQPLDVSVFGPFKRAFKRYKDAWTLQHCGRGASKMVLAHWVSAALQKSLTESNIKVGFQSTGIWPFNSGAVNQYMTPSQQFIQANNIDNDEDTDVEEELDTTMEENDEGINDNLLDQNAPTGISEDSLDHISAPQFQDSKCPRQQYFVGGLEPSTAGCSAIISAMASGTPLALVQTAGYSAAVSTAATATPLAPVPTANRTVATTSGQSSIHRFLQLPEVPLPERRRKCREEPLIDYNKSIMLTSNDYMHSMEVKSTRKEKARQEAEQHKVDAEKRKDLRAAKKLQKQAESAQ